VRNNENPFVANYRPSIAYVELSKITDFSSGTITLTNGIITALVMGTSSTLVLCENDTCIVFYNFDLVERDFASFLSETLSIKLNLPVSIPDNSFSYKSGAKIRAENGFLKVYNDGNVKTFAASIMAESVFTIRERLRA
jgi:hypothetical protein